MENITAMYEKYTRPELFLSGLFIIYLVMGFQMPEPVAVVVDSLFGKLVVGISALMLFAYTNPVLGVLGVLVAYKMIMGAGIVTGSAALEMYAPTEEKKWTGFPTIHKFPYTLEQEMVKKMAPMVHADSVSAKSTYKPIMGDIHDAVSVTYTGVI